MSRPRMPAAMAAPTIAPMEEPAITTGRMPRSSSTSTTWICASPRAPPPPGASADLASLRRARPSPSGPRRAGRPAAGRRRPDDEHGRLVRQQAARGRRGLLPRHGVDQVAAALDIVDAEILDLYLNQRIGDG